MRRPALLRFVVTREPRSNPLCAHKEPEVVVVLCCLRILHCLLTKPKGFINKEFVEDFATTGKKENMDAHNGRAHNKDTHNGRAHHGLEMRRVQRWHQQQQGRRQ